MEVTKATEIMANNVNGIMTLVVTVKRLEEGQQILQGRVDRLKKNNAELRAALVKISSSLHVDVENDQGNAKMVPSKSENSLCLDENAEPVDTPPITETGELTPLLIPEILQMILRNLDEKSLHGCRLVSKKLNEAAADVISKQYPQHIELSVCGKSHLQTPETLSRLHSLMRNSDAPVVLMHSLHSSGCRIMGKECLSILQEFGWALKMLYIQGCVIRFSTIQSILLEWCPNLEELKLDSLHCLELETPNSAEDFGFQSLEPNLKTSKLQRLSIYAEQDNMNKPKLNPQFLTSILQLSPNLKFLKTFGSDVSLATQLMKQLKTLPTVTNKFEELWIDYAANWNDDEEASNIITLVLDLELGPNLKTLTFEANQSFKYDDISGLINKLASQLQTMNLLMNPEYERDEEPGPIEIPWKTALPKMPMLKVFKCTADDYFHFESIDFLENMPNLERFTLGKADVSEYLLPGRIDDLFSSSVSSKPHNLKELILLGTMESDLTTTSISQKLPNLTKFFAGLGNVTLSIEGKACEEWFENVFEGFGKMENLQILYVDFGHFDWNVDVKLEVAFEKLVNLKSLRYLIFINYGKGVAGSNFVSALKSLLSKANKLQCLRLIKFKMLLSDSTNLTDWLRERRTTTRVEFSIKHPDAFLLSS